MGAHVPTGAPGVEARSVFGISASVLVSLREPRWNDPACSHAVGQQHAVGFVVEGDALKLEGDRGPRLKVRPGRVSSTPLPRFVLEIPRRVNPITLHGASRKSDLFGDTPCRATLRSGREELVYARG